MYVREAAWWRPPTRLLLTSVRLIRRA